METVWFDSHGARCEAWWLPAETDELTHDAGRPCVVMAHGFGVTRDSGLLPFAERFAAGGCDVLVFDYRGFGGSEAPVGGPRQDVDHRRHREDYRSAVDWVRSRAGSDPARVALWGSSYSGGHVVAVAAGDPRIAAVVSQGAAMDGLAALTGRGMRRPPGEQRPAKPLSAAKVRRLSVAVSADLARAGLRRDPVLVPFFGPAGSGALIAGDGAEAFTALTGPTFRNEMCARGVLRIAANRPVRRAAEIRCPTLLVVAEFDEVAPSSAVHEVARRIGDHAEVVSYDSGHFDIYVGEVFEDSVTRQVDFLRRVLS